MLRNIFNAKPRSTVADDRAAAVCKADRARDAGDYAQAAVFYQRVIDHYGPDFGILVQRGNALKDSGAFDEAERAYFEALRLGPSDADCHLQLGHLMKLAGRLGAAREFYGAALRLDPSQPDAARELRRMDEAASESEGPSARAPERMVVSTADRGDRAGLMRGRFTEALQWRRD